MSMSQTIAPAHLGYNSVGGGGINNQKLALVGLFLTALETGASLCLPDITLTDQVNKRYDPLPFGQVFAPDGFHAAAERFGLQLLPYDRKALPSGYENYFWKARNFIPGMFSGINPRASDLALSLLGAFVPRLRETYLLRKLGEDIFGKLGIEVAAQMRIEADWKKHCETNPGMLAKLEEQNYLPPEAIVGKILAVLPGVKRILVFCDEAALLQPKETIRQNIHTLSGVELVFKSDFISPFEMELLRPTQLSLLDFELAMAAKYFIGISSSTFSKMVTLQSHAVSRRLVEHHYIYNHAAPEIQQRRDNGCHNDAARACGLPPPPAEAATRSQWQARRASLLKRHDLPSWQLSADQKIAVAAGAILEGFECGVIGGHTFFREATLNGQILDDGPWGVFTSHWRKLD